MGYLVDTHGDIYDMHCDIPLVVANWFKLFAKRLSLDDHSSMRNSVKHVVKRLPFVVYQIHFWEPFLDLCLATLFLRIHPYFDIHFDLIRC